MSSLADLRQLVRQRARFACEFCGVTETSTGGQLTLDHFRPKSKGGSDALSNLIYCCVRCNQYKQNYWPCEESALTIWNPSTEPANIHFFESENGTLLPRTKTGEFTIKRLRLNRPSLVAYRDKVRKQAEKSRLIEQYKTTVQLLEQVNRQLVNQVEEQQKLLEEQRNLLQFLLDSRD